MQANIIYTPFFDQDESKQLLLRQEFIERGITDYKIWYGLRDHPISRAINRSHKMIVKYAKKNNWPECCIMEDDVQFTSAGAWQRFLHSKPADFDLYLAGIYQRVYEGDRLVKFTGLHCYIIHERFYDTFLNTDSMLNPDVAVSGLGKFVVCRPFAAIQRPGWSANNGCETDYSSLLQEGDL